MCHHVLIGSVTIINWVKSWALTWSHGHRDIGLHSEITQCSASAELSLKQSSQTCGAHLAADKWAQTTMEARMAQKQPTRLFIWHQILLLLTCAIVPFGNNFESKLLATTCPLCSGGAVWRWAGEVGSEAPINMLCQTSDGFEPSHLASWAGSRGRAAQGRVIARSALSHRCLGAKPRAGLGPLH